MFSLASPSFPVRGQTKEANSPKLPCRQDHKTYQSRAVLQLLLVGSLSFPMAEAWRTQARQREDKRPSKGNNSMPRVADGKTLPGVFPMARAHSEGSGEGSTQGFSLHIRGSDTYHCSPLETQRSDQARHKEPQSRSK